MILSILAILIFLLIAVFIVGRIHTSSQFRQEVNELFSQSKSISDKVYNHEQISGLPEPVQRYFKHVLKDGQPYISYVRLKHDGYFKQDKNKDWIEIQGEQYFTAENPGFIWKGKTSLFSVRDMYVSGKGRIIVSLFGAIRIMKGEGPQYDQGELLRWLGESVWFPTNLLPGEHLQWLPVDLNTAKLSFSYHGMSLSYNVHFNERGEITQLETKRYMGEENLETWVGKVSDYKEMNGMKIPTKIEAIWRLDSGDYSYARFQVRNIEYNIPAKY